MADNRVAEGYQQVNTGNDAIAMSSSDIAARVAQMNAQAVQSGSPSSASSEIARLTQVANSSPSSAVGVSSAGGIQLAQDTLARLNGYGRFTPPVTTGVTDGSSPAGYSISSPSSSSTQNAGAINYSNTNQGGSSGASGGTIRVVAKAIVDSGTGTMFEAIGGNGGNGSNGDGYNIVYGSAGGGAGGSGGHGGNIILIYKSKTGTCATSVVGGTKGTAGTGDGNFTAPGTASDGSAGLVIDLAL